MVAFDAFWQKYLWAFNIICSILVYEGGSVLTQARSLWRIELARTKWSGGYLNWYHPTRIRHITTGLYLGTLVNADDGPGELVLLKR